MPRVMVSSADIWREDDALRFDWPMVGAKEETVPADRADAMNAKWKCMVGINPFVLSQPCRLMNLQRRPLGETREAQQRWGLRI
mmetsp:Transcript_2106/g.3337  ORF Transcript_2106/g.3337 Transcript_2106/m.3337 type:complete len:84 (+) Transcript_2106:1445-1696(+)